MNRRPNQFIACFVILLAALGMLQGQKQPAANHTATDKATSSKKGAQTAEQAEPEALRKIKIPPLREFHPQQPKRIQLENGMVIFLQEDHELPVVSGSFIIRGGSTSEPADKVGLVDLYGEVWRTGGTTSKTGDQIDDVLESHAAKVETEGGGESTSLDFSCLKEDLDLVFDQAVDILRNPAFRPDKLELAKQELDTSISRRNDQIEDIASREAHMLAYGAKNPFARQPEYATVNAVTQDDLVAWHKNHLFPNYIIVGIVGDFDSAAMEAKLRKAFESLPAGPPFEAPKIDFHNPTPGIYYAAKDDVNQSHIDMVALGTLRSNPDFYALQVMNQIFSGGFGSRLMDDIRTKKGLAYEVGGGYGADYDHPGIFHIVTSTKSGTTVAAINALYQEVDDLKKVPFTAQELNRAKNEVLNSFVFHYAAKDEILHERMRLEFYGYPADFLQRYRDGVEKVTLADVNRVANKYVDKSKLAVLVVGNASDFDHPLSTLGPVTKIDLTIPGAPPGAQAGEQAGEQGAFSR